MEGMSPEVALVALFGVLLVARQAVVQRKSWLSHGEPIMRVLERQPSFTLNELRVFTDAVGGHTSKQRGPAMLQGHGVILKAFQDSPNDSNGDEKDKTRKLRGEMEAEFYKRVYGMNHPIIAHQPRYMGVQELSDGNKYLVLEDLTFGFHHPCVLDLKMGRKSYDEDATPAKIAKEKAKYPPQEIVGFRFSGMKVYQPATGDWVLSTREWCLSLEPAMIPDALERFFFDGRSVRRTLIKSVVEQVSAITKCLEDFPTWRMYGASLLIVYDGASPDDTVKAKLIDFSHCYEIKDSGGKDYGFLHGLYFLLSSLNEILDRGRKNLTRRNSLVDSAARILVQTSERSLEESSETSPVHSHMPFTNPSGSTATSDTSISAATPQIDSLESLQQDPHLAPLVRKKFSTDEEFRRSKRRTKSMHDVLAQTDGFSKEDSPMSTGSAGGSLHHRSPSSNAALSGSSPTRHGFASLEPPPPNKRSKSTESNASSSPFEFSPLKIGESVRDAVMALTTSNEEDKDTIAEDSKSQEEEERVLAQIGGSHSNIFASAGTIQKDEVDKDHFENEARFYQLIVNDPLNKVTPAFIRVDEQARPRRLILEDVTSLVTEPIPAALEAQGDLNTSTSTAHHYVNIMDVKLGVRSFRSDVSNEAKKSYYDKYLECVSELDPEQVQRVWTQICGNPGGPASLCDNLLGKKDYLLFRDGTTTSSEYGFRLTALKHFDFEVTQDEAKTKVNSYNEFVMVMSKFLSSGKNGFDSELAANFISEIDSILEAIRTSDVFEDCDFVGTSLLFVHQGGVPVIRWIDFANVTSPSSDDHNGIVYGVKKIRSILDSLIRTPQVDI